MIPGFFDPRQDWPVPYVRASLWLPDVQPKWVSIDFLLDTGAGTTSLHPLDVVVRVGISPSDLVDVNKWQTLESHGGVGGEAVYFLVPAYYALLQDDDEWLRVTGEIRIAQLTTGNTRLPSLLGWDLLAGLPSRSRLGDPYDHAVLTLSSWRDPGCERTPIRAPQCPRQGCP